MITAKAFATRSTWRLSRAAHAFAFSGISQLDSFFLRTFSLWPDKDDECRQKIELQSHSTHRRTENNFFQVSSLSRLLKCWAWKPLSSSLELNSAADGGWDAKVFCKLFPSLSLFFRNELPHGSSIVRLRAGAALKPAILLILIKETWNWVSTC